MKTEDFDGNHQAIIDPNLFFSLNEMKPLTYHKRRKKIDRVFLLKGLVRCGVHGCMMPLCYIRKRTGPNYYVCTKKSQYKGFECPVGYANADKLENVVVRLKEISAEKPVFESLATGQTWI